MNTLSNLPVQRTVSLIEVGALQQHPIEFRCDRAATKSPHSCAHAVLSNLVGLRTRTYYQAPVYV